ncbi:hypothetical protein DY000_02034214 [Brassica cretica]|uniref:Uncharacterized protein n=1 Tax=Brassica cretica TaxID=69181 RepID=A0ABQ7DVN7_BRACR|nr:hypothetical protein DY000_02034214 [Brassica cretica]
MLTREDMAVMLRLNFISHRATLEGRELTCIEIRMAQQLKKVFYWVPPTQLEDIASDLNSHVLINECLDLICETRKLDDLRVEKLVRDHIEVCLDKNYLCPSIDLESEFLMLDEPRPLLELADLGDELDVDRLLLEIENPLVKNFHENENIGFYLIDGDRVDYFVKTSFEPVVKFVFPPNAFDSHDHLNLKEHFIIHDAKGSTFSKCLIYALAIFLSRLKRRLPTTEKHDLDHGDASFVRHDNRVGDWDERSRGGASGGDGDINAIEEPSSRLGFAAVKDDPGDNKDKLKTEFVVACEGSWLRERRRPRCIMGELY